MGAYSTLTLDKYYTSLKYEIPYLSVFLFSKEDLFYEKEEIDEETYFEMGYKCKVKDSIAELESYGFTLDFIAENLKKIREHANIDEFYDGALRGSLAVQKQFEINEGNIEDEAIKFLNKFEYNPSEREILDDFLKLLDITLFGYEEDQVENGKIDLELCDGSIYQLPINERPTKQNIQNSESKYLSYFGELSSWSETNLPPWLVKECYLFDYHAFEELGEIMPLFYYRLILELSNPEGEVSLDVGDIYGMEGYPEDPQEELKQLHNKLAKSIVTKVELFNNVYDPLIAKESNIREQFVKNEVSKILNECETVTNIQEKGRKLEKLTETLFTNNNQFNLIEKNVNTGDEEIDLVFANNISDPFWDAFNSPLFFVECKNWSNSKVGSKELRDFEGKIRNHQLVKVGFFLSLNGFTSMFFDELKRVTRENFHIVPLEGKDIEEYLRSRDYFYNWIKSKSSKIY